MMIIEAIFSFVALFVFQADRPGHVDSNRPTPEPLSARELGYRLFDSVRTEAPAESRELRYSTVDPDALALDTERFSASGGSRSVARDWTSPVYRGMLIVDGQFMPRPYALRVNAGGLAVNGHKIPLMKDVRAERIQQEIVHLLSANSVVAIARDGSRDVVNTGSQQLELLSAAVGDGSLVGTKLDGTRWRQHLDAVLVSSGEDFRRVAKDRLKEINKAVSQNISSSKATQRLNQAAYPLTVFGMAVCVFSMGHLLQTAPRIQTEEQRLATREQWIRASSISVSLFVMMALLDLTWTLMASSAGQMQELNPFGNLMMGNPVTLITLKVTATLMSAGILLGLRSNAIAQKAAWWVCLLCTLLTMRWLVFNSLFVG